MKINPNIFKAYDIRGKFPAEINEEVAELVGGATARFLCQKSRKKHPRVVVCRDIRASSPILADAIIKGLFNHDAHVLDGGVGTTPYFYFVLNRIKSDGGIMVTASHNPPGDNGFKFQDKTLRAISIGSGLEVIKKYVEQEKFSTKEVSGEISQLDNFFEEYLNFISKGITINPINIVVDPAGGAETLFINRLLARFNTIHYKPLFFEPDGSFANHSPNPITAEGQQFVQRELQKGGYDFGVVFDGDSDRIIFLDEKGTPVRADFIFAILAEQELKRRKKATFVGTLNISKGVREYIKEQGGNVKLSPQGYPYLQKMMRRLKAPVGVEMSGHYHFQKTFFRDSTLLPFLQIAAYLSKAKEPLSIIVRRLQRYVSSKEISFPVTNQKKIIEGVKRKYAQKGGKLSFLDGITIEFPDWWFNLRAANTEPVVRLVLEAKDQKLFDEKLKEVEDLIKSR